MTQARKLFSLLICLAVGQVLIAQGAALSSNGGSQYISVPDNASLDIDDQLSIELWCKPSNFPTWGAMVMKASGNSWGNGYGIYLFGSELKFFPASFGFQHSSGQNLPLNEWSHVAATYDGTESKIYVNGALVSTKNIDRPIPTNGFPMGIGGDPGYPSFNFRGALDEVRIWSKALTQAEIQANMNCEIQTTADCLVANYHLNQGAAGQNNASETTLNDASGNGNNGTLNGYQLNGTASNWIAPGGVTSGQACSGSISCLPGGGGGNPDSDMTSVPTMSQWGLILFALLILTLSTITAMQRELTTEGTGNSSFSIKHFPFEKNSFIFWLVSTALALILVFTVSILFWGYELTNADIPGSLLAIPIGAYLLHLLFGDKSSE